MAILYVWSGAAGSGSGADWTNAKTTLTAAFTTEVAGDTLYVAHDHVDTSTGITYTSSGTVANPTKVVCVDRAGTVPPVSADKRTTAQVVTTASGNISLTGVTHYDGIIFNSNNGIFAQLLDSTWVRFDNCSLRLSASGAVAIALGGASDLGILVELNNTTMSFAGVANTVQIAAKVKWRNTPLALIGAAVPTILFTPVGQRGGDLECIGVDLSAAGSGKTIAGTFVTATAHRYRFIDCKLNASVTKSTVPDGTGAVDMDFIRSGSSGNYAVHSHRQAGLLTEETTIVRTGGASDGTTPISWKVVTTANCNYSMPFECPPIAIWNDTTGSAVTATVECIGTAIATDKEVWLDLEYLSDASAPQGAFISDSADILATAANQTSSSETWGGVLTGKFKLAVTFTPQQPGWVYCRVRCAKASSSFYIDALVTLS